MNEINQNEWTDEEARALAALAPVDASIPSGGKARVMEQLKTLGLLTSRPPRAATWIPWATAAVLAVAAFGLGRATSLSASAPAEEGQRYVLLLNGAGSLTPAENVERRKEYGDWLSDLRRRGLGVDGAELMAPRHDLPEPLSGPPVVGYFIITAHSEAEALKIAEATPHLKHGGGVTVAAIR